LKPTWKTFRIPLERFGKRYDYAWRVGEITKSPRLQRDQGYLDETLVIECWNWSSFGEHQYIGKTEPITLRRLIYSTLPTFLLTNERKKARTVPVVSGLTKDIVGKSVHVYYNNSGKIIFKQIERIEEDMEAKVEPEAFRLVIKASGITPHIGFNLHGPFFVVRRVGTGQELYKTELKKFSGKAYVYEPFVLNLSDVGELTSELKFECYQWSKAGNIYLGGFIVTLLSLSHKNILKYWINNENQKSSSLTLVKSIGKVSFLDVTEVSAQHFRPPPNFEITFAAKNLERKDKMGFGKSDPYFKIVKEYSSSTPIYTSEYVVKELNPSWNPFDLKLSSIGTIDSPFVVEVWDWNRTSPHRFIGSCRVTLRDLANYERMSTHILINTKKIGQKLYQNSGTLVVVECTKIGYEGGKVGSGVGTHTYMSPSSMQQLEDDYLESNFTSPTPPSSTPRLKFISKKKQAKLTPKLGKSEPEGHNPFQGKKKEKKEISTQNTTTEVQVDNLSTPHNPQPAFVKQQTCPGLVQSPNGVDRRAKRKEEKERETEGWGCGNSSPEWRPDSSPPSSSPYNSSSSPYYPSPSSPYPSQPPCNPPPYPSHSPSPSSPYPSQPPYNSGPSPWGGYNPQPPYPASGGYAPYPSQPGAQGGWGGYGYGTGGYVSQGNYNPFIPSQPSQLPWSPPPSHTPLDPQLSQLLAQLHLNHLSDVFVQANLTYQALLNFSESDMEELGISDPQQRHALHSALNNS